VIEGEIEVDNVPALWNEKMLRYLGINTEGNYQNGSMQDIHWTVGAIGYFPTYTLGAMYAAQLFQAASRAVPQLEAEIEEGNLQGLSGWLNIISGAKVASIRPMNSFSMQPAKPSMSGTFARIWNAASCDGLLANLDAISVRLAICDFESGR
jgi:hypothetical protein